MTILRPDVYYKISPISRPILNSTDVNVAMADGELTRCLGRGKLQIKISNTKDYIMHDVYLANIEPEGILGYDLLQEHDYLLDLGKGEMRIGRRQVKCSVYMSSVHGTQV